MLTVCTPTSVSTGGGTATINTNGSVTLSSATMITLNGVFSATYDNYMVSLRSVNNSSSGSNVRGSLTSVGTPNSGTYYSQNTTWSSTTLSGSRANSTTGTFCYSSTTLADGVAIYFFAPFLSQYTMWRSTTVSGSTNSLGMDVSGVHIVKSSFDGFQFDAVSGGLTGLVTVYGFNQ